MINKGMASSSCIKQGSMPMNNICITPEATYEAIVADPKLFMSSLERLHSLLGTKFMVPIIGGRDLDLHKLFIEVTSRGGINKILHERRWKDVTATFVFPPTATNASYVLRKYYFSLLNNYEQIYFLKSNSQIPPDSLQSNSIRPQGTIRPSHELQALTFTPHSNTDSRGSLTGSNVIGVIDGKFENGYLITVTIGSEQLKGVLYQLSTQNKTLQTNSQGIITTSQVTKHRRRRRRKKSEIKRRDPSHPKPNRSGYNFFFSEQHARLKPLNPGKDREISRMIGELWNKLNEQERLVYQEKAMEDKERYRIEMEGYREKLKTEGQVVSNAVPLQQRLPEEEVEEDDDEEEGESSGCSGESEVHGESDVELEEPLGQEINPNLVGIVVAPPPMEKTGDVVMEISPLKKAEEATVVVATAAAQN